MPIEKTEELKYKEVENLLKKIKDTAFLETLIFSKNKQKEKSLADVGVNEFNLLLSDVVIHLLNEKAILALLNRNLVIVVGKDEIYSIFKGDNHEPLVCFFKTYMPKFYDKYKIILEEI